MVRTRCSISFPPVPKRSSTKRSMIPALDCPVAGLPAMGSSVFFIYSIYFCPHTRIGWDVACLAPPCRVILVPGSPTRLYWVQHVTASVSSRGNHAITAQCLVKNVPPASGGIIHAVCRFLQFWGNIGRITCFWWQFTHNITIHTIRLSMKESCLTINVKDVPTLAGCHLATHPKSGSCGSRRICLLIVLLFVLETS